MEAPSEGIDGLDLLRPKLNEIVRSVDRLAEFYAGMKMLVDGIQKALKDLRDANKRAAELVIPNFNSFIGDFPAMVPLVPTGKMWTVLSRLGSMVDTFDSDRQRLSANATTMFTMKKANVAVALDQLGGWFRTNGVFLKYCHREKPERLVQHYVPEYASAVRAFADSYIDQIGPGTEFLSSWAEGILNHADFFLRSAPYTRQELVDLRSGIINDILCEIQCRSR